MSPKPPKGPKTKAKYQKPHVRTESLTAVAAVCNGTSVGGKKMSVAGPPICSASKLKS